MVRPLVDVGLGDSWSPFPSDFSTLLGGGGSDGFDLSGLLGGMPQASSSGNGSGNFFGSLLGGAASLIPGLGPVAGPLIGQVGNVIGGLFGGSTPNGSSEFDGLHSTVLPRLEASSLKMGEVKIYAAYARALRTSVEVVKLLMETDAATSTTGASFAFVMDSWGAPMGPPALLGSPDVRNARVYITRYNQMHPNTPIVEGQLDPQGMAAPAQPVVPLSGLPAGLGFTGGSGLPAALPGLGFMGGASSPAAAAQQNLTLGDILKAGGNGAVKSVGDLLSDTPAGQQMQKDIIWDKVKKYQLPLAAAGLGVLWLIANAVKNANH